MSSKTRSGNTSTARNSRKQNRSRSNSRSRSGRRKPSTDSKTTSGEATRKRKRDESTSSTSSSATNSQVHDSAQATETTTEPPDCNVTSAGTSTTTTTTTATATTQTEMKEPVSVAVTSGSSPAPSAKAAPAAAANRVGVVVDRLFLGEVPSLLDDVMPRAIDDLDGMLRSELFDRRTLSQLIFQDQMTQPAQKHLRLPELTVDDLRQSTSASPRSSAASPRSSAVNDFDVSSSPATKRRAVICDDRPFAVDVGNESDDVDDDSAELEGRKPVTGNFGVYQLVVDQATLIERLLHDFSGHLIVLKTWLSVHTPPTVDGQNMDVAVLTLAAVTLATAKDFYRRTVEAMRNYRQTRHRAVAVATDDTPNVVDAKLLVNALDEREFHAMRRAAVEMRQHYVSICRVIGKNRATIEHPLSSDNQPYWL